MFFKQKTAYEMRISDWSSDVCSSDLWPGALAPLFALAIVPENRQDEVKLSAALQKLTDEDPSLSVEHNADTHEMLIWGQGEIHLQIARSEERRVGKECVSP